MRDIANMDERKAAMRLEDLLTMRSGTDFHEQGPDSPLFQMNRLSRGWDKFYLDRPMVQPPGTGFQYDSGGVVLISAMLKQRTGMHADKYAERHLFEPLGIKKYSWLTNAEGHAHTGGGLLLSGRDMASSANSTCRKAAGGAPSRSRGLGTESLRMHVDLTRRASRLRATAISGGSGPPTRAARPGNTSTPRGGASASMSSSSPSTTWSSSFSATKRTGPRWASPSRSSTTAS